LVFLAHTELRCTVNHTSDDILLLKYVREVSTTNNLVVLTSLFYWKL